MRTFCRCSEKNHTSVQIHREKFGQVIKAMHGRGEIFQGLQEADVLKAQGSLADCWLCSSKVTKSFSCWLMSHRWRFLAVRQMLRITNTAT